MVEYVKKHVRGRQSRMPAKVYLEDRGKPAEFNYIATPYEKCGLRKVVFRCNPLQNQVGEPIVKRTDSRGITAEGFGGKGVDVVIGDSHCAGEVRSMPSPRPRL